MTSGVNNKVRKPVSFNKSKPNDVRMLKFLGRRNFSGYVKKLIMEDMLKKEKEKEMVSGHATTVNEAETKPQTQKREPESRPVVEVPLIEPEKELPVVESAEEQLNRLKKQLNKTKSEPKVFIANHRQI